MIVPESLRGDGKLDLAMESVSRVHLNILTALGVVKLIMAATCSQEPFIIMANPRDERLLVGCVFGFASWLSLMFTCLSHIVLPSETGYLTGFLTKVYRS